MTTVQYITVERDRAGQRIDNFLITYFKLPKQLIYRWLRKGELRVNKKRIQPTYRLQAGDLLRIPPFTQVKDKETARISEDHLQYLQSLILYENKDYLIINKPSGIAVHGGSGIQAGSAPALFPQSGSCGRNRSPVPDGMRAHDPGRL